MKEDDAVKITYITPEIHAEFINGVKTRNTNYDILVKEWVSTILLPSCAKRMRKEVEGHRVALYCQTIY